MEDLLSLRKRKTSFLRPEHGRFCVLLSSDQSAFTIISADVPVISFLHRCRYPILSLRHQLEYAGVAVMVAVPLVPVDAAFHADLPELDRVLNYLTVLVDLDLGVDVQTLEYGVRLVAEAVVGDDIYISGIGDDVCVLGDGVGVKAVCIEQLADRYAFGCRVGRDISYICYWNPKHYRSGTGQTVRMAQKKGINNSINSRANYFEQSN